MPIRWKLLGPVKTAKAYINLLGIIFILIKERGAAFSAETSLYARSALIICGTT